jgi:type I restriction enzyme, S subunit
MIADPSAPLRAGLKPYPAMKDSGVPWLGDVPEDWSILRGRNLFEIKKRIAGELGHEVLSVTQAGLRVRDVHSNEGQVSQDYSKYQIVNPGEFVMNSMDLITGGVGIADHVGVTSPDYRVFAIRDTSLCRDLYVLHLFRMLYGNRGFYAWGQGSAQLGRWRLPRKRFNEFPFPVPPLPEQAAIVRFLDHVDRRIRRYIRAKQKLMKLLEEQKQAIIHRAVTRGLDPNVRLKFSGVEWLGDVPEHWEVVPLRRYIEISSGDFITTDKVSESPSVDRPLPVIGGNGVMGYCSSFNSEGITIVIGRVGALCGNVHLVEGRAWVTDNALRIARIKAFEPEYLVLQLRAMNLNRLSNANAQPLITGGIVKEQHAVRPALNDQRSLVQAVMEAIKQVEAAINAAHREIDLVREYRTRLVADVVTGKLDVREAAARLPEEIEEPEPLEQAEGDVDAHAADELDAVTEEAEA